MIRYLKDLINYLNEPVVLLDKNLNIIIANSNFFNLIYDDRKDLNGISFYKVIENYCEKYLCEELINPVLEGKINTSCKIIEFISLLNEKRILSVKCSFISLMTEIPEYLLIVFKDITEERRNEEISKEIETKYKNLFEGISEAVYQVTPEGRILTFNSAMAKLFGWDDGDEFLNINIEKDLYVFPVQRREKMVILEKEGELKNFELELRRKDGRIIYVIENARTVRDNLGKTLYYEGILTNITDRKKFEIDLEISRQKYYHLFEFASDAIFLLDRELFIDANRKALEIFGCTSKKEILGKTPIDFSPEYQSNGFKSSEKAKEMIRNVIKGENQLFEWLHWTKDKKLVITEVNLTLVILRDKTYIQAIVRDISDRKEMEVQIIKEKEKALEADKLKTAFLSNISHEIRTPLNSIMGFTSLMLKHNYTSSEQLEMLNMINKSGNLLLSMINDIVDISKIETGQMKITEGEYHLNKIFDDIYNDFTRREDYLLISDVKFKLFKQLIDGDDIVQIDGNRLIRIIYTIIDNAFKFTNKGEIKLGYNIKGDRIEIYVSDTGIGIPVDKHKFIFDRFYTYENHNDKLSKGAGLGLPIAKELVQLMNGDIQVVSEPDKGSVFTIILPYNPIIKLKQKIIETDNKKQVNSLDDVLILVVEDDYNNYFFIQSLLKRVGMKHIWADNGYKAVELCHKYKDIKLILMDIRIPGIDGYQATKEIKIFRKDLPVIALTAYAMSDDRETAIMKGCDDYLAKPFYGDQLYELINKWLVK